MANEEKKDFNAMLKDSKDMPKFQVITDEKSIAKYGGSRMYFAPPIDYDRVMRLVPFGKLLTVGAIREYFAKQNGIETLLSAIKCFSGMHVPVILNLLPIAFSSRQQTAYRTAHFQAFARTDYRNRKQITIIPNYPGKLRETIDKPANIPYSYLIASASEKRPRATAKEMHQLKNTIISLKDITVSYDGEQVLGGFNLDIHDGEFVTLLGPSGCGKTTALRTIAGFIKPDKGDVFFYEKNITNLPPHKREVNTIFQKYALFPHLNVYENIAFGMRLKGRSEKEIKQTVHEMLAKVNLTGYAHRGISQLSGGQQQRVAIARALANEPKVLLLDEPLGALDLKLRKDMQVELKKLQQQTGITFVFVTHDQEEALSMSDTVVVMDGGVIQQIGTPTDIYNEPKNAFVADFIGESNILDGIMLDDYSVKFAGHIFRCLDSGFGKNTPVDVVIRPEDIKVVEPDSTLITGDVTSVTFKGVHYEIIVDVAGFKWMIQSTECREAGDRIGLSLTPNDIHVMQKSEYSGMFGDYSTFSDEMGEDIIASDEANALEKASTLEKANAPEKENTPGKANAPAEAGSTGEVNVSPEAAIKAEGDADEI